MASAISAKVSKVPGAFPTRSSMAVFTNAVVAICVVLVADAAVGAVGVPVSAGEASGALLMTELRVAAGASAEPPI